MLFEVIPNEQTPAVHFSYKPNEYVKTYKDVLLGFLEYAKTRYDAAGLAANQCSLDGERFKHPVFAIKDPEWRLIICPRIDEYIGIKEIKVEGCLTWKGMRVVAERSRAVKVRYYTETGEFKKDEIYKGFIGQVWQHEINHLNGVEERIEPFWFVEPKPIDVGRNESCPCGSGKKYKQCCLKLL